MIDRLQTVVEYCRYSLANEKYCELFRLSSPGQMRLSKTACSSVLIETLCKNLGFRLKIQELREFRRAIGTTYKCNWWGTDAIVSARTPDCSIVVTTIGIVTNTRTNGFFIVFGSIVGRGDVSQPSETILTIIIRPNRTLFLWTYVRHTANMSSVRNNIGLKRRGDEGGNGWMLTWGFTSWPDRRWTTWAIRRETVKVPSNIGGSSDTHFKRQITHMYRKYIFN